MAQLIIDIDEELIKEGDLEVLKNDVEKMLNFRRLHKVAKGLKEALTQVELHQQGKIELQTFDEMMNKIREECNKK